MTIHAELAEPLLGIAKFILRDGSVQSAEIADGVSLAEFARANNIPGILAECGCNLACATCHVYVAEDWLAALTPPSSLELDMIEGTAAPANARSRLSCQLIMSKSLDGLTVKIPDEQ
jgi:2Fe-2S ferredoxin